MLHENLSVGTYPSGPDDEPIEDPFEDTRVVYDSDRFGEFFPDRPGGLRGRASENGRYLACWRKKEQTGRDATCPGGVCLAEDGAVVHISELANVKCATPANDGTMAVLARVDGTHRLSVFDPNGAILLQDIFESNVSAMAIAPDGDHVALSTAFPDNAVHLYRTHDSQYLGRAENPSTNVLGKLRFEDHDGDPVIETYEIGPDSDLNVRENRTQVIDRIPVEPQIDVRSLEGVCMVNSESDGVFHFISNSEMNAVKIDLRTPGVQVDAACGCSLEPASVDTIYSESKEAVESQFEFCSKCQSEFELYPDSKVERDHH